MDSCDEHLRTNAHCDERKLAHSAAGRNIAINVESAEIAKLKEDHEKQIQKLTFENRIKILELEEEMSKQDKEQKMKILQLEKDNQSLTHELELLKLKAAYELDSKKGVYREMEKEVLKQQNAFQNEMTAKENEFKVKMKGLENAYESKLSEKDKELVMKQNECKMKIDEMEKVFQAKEHEYQARLTVKENEYQAKLAAKKSEFVLKMKDLENANNIKLEQVEREKESATQSLRHRIEMMEVSKDNGLIKDPKPVNVPRVFAKLPEKSVVTMEEKLIWGANEFYLGIKTGSNMFTSYENWYEAISALLRNRKLESVKQGCRQYFFIKKEMVIAIPSICLVFRRENDNYGDSSINVVAIEYPNRNELTNARSFLLHTKQRDQCIESGKFEKSPYRAVREFWYSGVTESHHFGEKKSIIIFFYL